MKLDWNSAVSLIGGNSNGWSVNEISILYYYDNITKHKNYFQLLERNDDLSLKLFFTLACYTTDSFIDTSLFKNVLANKK